MRAKSLTFSRTMLIPRSSEALSSRTRVRNISGPVEFFGEGEDGGGFASAGGAVEEHVREL